MSFSAAAAAERGVRPQGVLLMNALPEPVTAVAYRAANGELAWRRAELPAALLAIAEAGLAVLGGEVWLAVGDGRWDGLIPDACGGLPGVWHWDTAPRLAGESWLAFCHRAAEESARAVAEMRVEEESDPAVWDRLYFNLTYVTEAELHRLSEEATRLRQQHRSRPQ
jgi:hypothetical protein